MGNMQDRWTQLHSKSSISTCHCRSLMCLEQKQAWQMSQVHLEVRACRVGAAHEGHLRDAQSISRAVLNLRPKRTDIGLFVRESNAQEEHQDPEGQPAGGRLAHKYVGAIRASRIPPLARGEMSTGGFDMPDPNLLKGAESGDRVFMWCASFVTQRRASLSHKFEGEEGVVWAGWDIRRQQMI